MIFVVLAACGSVQSSSGGGGGGACEYKEPGTQYAACSDDSDCYSGWCKLDGTPGPFCSVPSHAARAGLHGYSCASDADCNGVLGADGVASGLYGICHDDAIYDGCAFYCGTGGGGGGSGNGSGSGSGSGGSPAPDGGV